jgi:hypothetical protein
MKPRIRVLFLAANSNGSTRLELGREFNKIRDAIAGAKHRDAFELIPPEFSAQIETLNAALIKYRPHVVHFAGHGSSSHGLIFEDRDGYSRPAGKPELATLFKGLRGPKRLLFLNACYTKDQGSFLDGVFDYVIGTSGAIEDRCAIEFARNFYKYAAEGATVGEAFLATQFAINNCGMFTSELLKRPGVDDSKSLVAQILQPASGKLRSRSQSTGGGRIEFNNYGEIGTVLSATNSRVTVNMERRKR